MIPDNRIRLSSTKIDFESSVGLTGLEHDDYPPPQGQARFDHMRMYLIGLLSQQSSYDEPTEKRQGTAWFDLNSNEVKIWDGNSWSKYSNHILLKDSSDNDITLSDWQLDTNNKLANVGQEVFFGGRCSSAAVSDITVPVELREAIDPESKAFVVINGLSIDPRESQLIGSPVSTVRLLELELEAGDRFFVTFKRIPSSSYYTQDVIL